MTVSRSFPAPFARRAAPALILVLLAVELSALDVPIDVVGETDVQGGLCVQIGGAETTVVEGLARTGRFLVHVLHPDPRVVVALRRRLDDRDLLGIVSAERFDPADRLPYTENLVNLVIARARLPGPAWSELARVLAPGGSLLLAPGLATDSEIVAAGFDAPGNGAPAQTGWLVARKPWPPEMDAWSHPRHSAAGNAVSRDRLVGPPRRIRWLAGPWEEVNLMVTAGGRNYYGGVLARDAFNGLRLWERRVTPSPAAGGYGFRSANGSVPPIADESRLFVVSDGLLEALDGATGRVLQEYRRVEQPRELLHDDGLVFVVEPRAITAHDVESAERLWQIEATAPRHAVAGDGLLAFVKGEPRRGEPVVAVAVDSRTGEVRWSRGGEHGTARRPAGSDRGEAPGDSWLSRVARVVYHDGMLAYEVSSLNNDAGGNVLRVLSARDGSDLIDREFPPAMSHWRQARALFVGDDLWLLEGGRISEDEFRAPGLVSVDPRSGDLLKRLDAGLAHCFPPVATPRYVLSGEMDFTHLATGERDANPITKAACGRDGGWVPANGLVYVAPKHCVCWPMLRGYAALAPARPGGSPARRAFEEAGPRIDRGDAPIASASGGSEKTETPDGDDWPCYRHDAWRSASTPASGPRELVTVWSAALGSSFPAGPIGRDWAEDPFVKGPVSAPVIAGGRVYVARPHRHQVLALDAASGEERWRVTVDGRVDTPPTIHRGLCLFGSKAGSVFCLRASDGALVWRLQAAPLDERIVAYGQIESPWPVPGSVLVVDDTAYFAAGRQSLADGGILVFAVAPATGELRWVRRLDTLPQKGFYRSTGLEFDNFDLLHREGDAVAMSRWLFSLEGGAMRIDPMRAFARIDTGGGAAMVPQGSWSYAPRHQRRTREYTAKRSPVAFRDGTLFGCLQGMQRLFRRDFDLDGPQAKEKGEAFDVEWMTGWAAAAASRDGDVAWRSQRLAENATWSVDLFDGGNGGSQTVSALVVARDTMYIAGSSGEVQVRARNDGRLLAKRKLAPPLWDGLAIAGGRLYLTTAEGGVHCLGERSSDATKSR